MKRKILRSTVPAFLLAALPAVLPAERLTLPAAASVVGVAPFFSDARLFNTSYTTPLTVAATYRCFIGTCSSTPQTVTIGPRESVAYDDICVSLFSAPNSAGAIEFDFEGTEQDLVVTSRLYSTAPTPTVGMFIPALSNTAAHAVTVLTSVSNAGAGAGFRANVGAFNPEDAAVTATFRIFDDGVQVGDSLVRNLAGRAGTQINNIFGAAGVGGLATTNAVVVVEATGEIFTYAAVIDNATTDPIFVVGAEDAVPEPGFTPAATATPPGSTPTSTPTRTPTPTPTSPAATVVNLVATQFQWSFDGGGSSFVMRVGQTYELRIRDGDPAGTAAHGFSGIPGLGVSAATLTAGGAPVVRMVTPSAGQTGTHFFSCNRPTCGSGHDSMIASVQVQP